jgi:cephalosporin-C deacetylase-like acetyl esterase
VLPLSADEPALAICHIAVDKMQSILLSLPDIPVLGYNQNTLELILSQYYKEINKYYEVRKRNCLTGAVHFS